MALDQAALLELLDVMRSADGGDLMRRLLVMILQSLVDAEATASTPASRRSVTGDRLGLLPNTDRRVVLTYLYLRADVDQVLVGPFRGGRGRFPNFVRLLKCVNAAPV